MNPINSTSKALAAARQFQATSRKADESLQRIATGQRINRGSDDPAAMMKSERLRAIIAQLDAEARMLQRTDHVANTADGTLAQVSDMLIEAEAIVLTNANTTGMSDAERQANQMQLDSILASVDRLAGSATFNGQSLFSGSITLQVGQASVDLDQIATQHLGSIEIDGNSFSLSDLGTGGTLNIVDGDLKEAQETLNAARDQINSLRGRLGAFQRHSIGARLESLHTEMENVAGANAEIRDTDYARETANHSRLRLLADVSLKTLGQFNSNAKNVLNLLG